MPKTFSSAQLARLTEDGTFRAGPNLFLQRKGPTCSWLFRYRHHGVLHRMGLGPYPEVGLTEAQRRATAARRLLDQGVDPLRARRQERRAQARAAGSPTFGTVATEFIAGRKAGWRSAKQEEIWTSSLKTHAKAIYSLPVSDVTLDDVFELLRPIWTKKRETADRTRSRIKAVLDYAVAKGWREEGPNPADVTGPLGKLLPATGAKVEHHAALPYSDAPRLFAEARAVGGATANALAFLLLTAVRSGEARLARWGEFDLEAKVWTIPASRTKTGVEHVVPLTDAAIALLPEPRKPDRLVFPGTKPGKPQSDATVLKFLRTLRPRASVHGLRSTFRTWAAEQTDLPWEVAEAALGHTVGDQVERAYARTSFYEKRQLLMKGWAKYLESYSATLD